MSIDTTLADFLKKRAERSFRSFAREIETISSDDALRFSNANWPDHRWEVGQDGSICGIVFHVAAWKAMTLPMFAPGGRPLQREEFDPETAPCAGDWPQVRAWYSTIGNLWNETLQSLNVEEMSSLRDWEGQMMPVSSFVIEMMEHDVQHLSQIDYLKQRCLCDAVVKATSGTTIS